MVNLMKYGILLYTSINDVFHSSIKLSISSIVMTKSWLITITTYIVRVETIQEAT